jgi:hypothetical protein
VNIHDVAGARARQRAGLVSVFDVGVGCFFKSVTVSVVPQTSVIGFCTCALSLLDFNYSSSNVVSPVDGDVKNVPQ